MRVGRDRRIVALAAERKRRELRAALQTLSILFELQRRFVADRSRLIAICSARRAGKTHACAVKLLSAAVARPGVNCLYTALTLKQARRNIWARLLKYNADFGLGGKPSESSSQGITLTLPNGSVIHVSGMDETAEADKWRGLPNLVLVIVDEAQSYRDVVLDYAITEVFRPGMLDLADSQLVLSGSPGPLPVGYFHDVIHAEQTAWSRHGWTTFDNPMLGGDPHEVIADACRDKGITVDAPWIQRNFYNRWVQDLDSLIYPYDEARNDWRPGQSVPAGSIYVIGVDFGVRDADAIVVWALYERTVYMVEQHCHRGQTTDQIVAQIRDVQARFHPVDMVGDPSGGGARIANDLSSVHGIALRAADKAERIAAINMMADAMRSGRVRAPRESRLVQEWRRLEWEPGHRGVKERRGGPHFDLPDAALYGWRAASKYFSLEAPPPATPPDPVELLFHRDEDEDRRQSDDWAENDWR